MNRLGAEAAFQAKRKHEEEEKRKGLEAKRKRDEAVLADQLEDFDLEPPSPPKVVTAVCKTALVRGKTKCQATLQPSILDAAGASALASLNMGDKGGCDDSDTMSSSRESEELNKAKKN